jgi:hypothetical protein
MTMFQINWQINYMLEICNGLKMTVNEVVRVLGSLDRIMTWRRPCIVGIKTVNLKSLCDPFFFVRLVGNPAFVRINERTMDLYRLL